MEKKEAKFSVALGLFDYINPIMYSLTTGAIVFNIKKIMCAPWNYFYIIGAIISLIFGLTIPTIKLLVGLGKLKFKMPVNLVFYVNSGIFISGFALLQSIYQINVLPLILMAVASILVLLFVYYKTKKFNTVAVLTGFIGYLVIYVSLITLAISLNVILPIILYALGICFFISLVLIGIKANLKDAKIHWIIESCNVLCQTLVAIATLIIMNL